MGKEIICVYQDCVMCGDRGKKLEKIIVDKSIDLKKISFASNEGRDLVHTALFKKGIRRLPFFVDGDNFAEDINALIEKPLKKQTGIKKTRKKSTKKVKEISEIGGEDESVE